MYSQFTNFIYIYRYILKFFLIEVNSNETVPIHNFELGCIY